MIVEISRQEFRKAYPDVEKWSGIINIGNFYISDGCQDDKIWIARQDGEGGEFDIKALEAVIKKFYEDNF